MQALELKRGLPSKVPLLPTASPRDRLNKNNNEMKAKSARAKGKLLENYIADQVVAKGLDNMARRDGASGAGTRDKGDVVTSMTVLGRNVSIEAKNQKTISFPAWWEQCEHQASMTGYEPLLVTKYEGESLEATKVTLYLDTFLDLVKKAQEPKTANTENRELQWALTTLKNSSHKVLKLIEK